MGKTGWYEGVVTGKKQRGFVFLRQKEPKNLKVKTSEDTVHFENNLFK